MRIRSILLHQLRELFTRVDVIVAPSRYNVAPKITEDLDAPDPPPGGNPKSRGMKDLIPAGNLAGIPALTVPCGFANNLPLGLQLVGSAFSENTILALGTYFQEKTDWHKRRPPLVS
jgi:aspartyl-tRNA(Asn)/glutamyl-tRNA(Gln) amidotransferase subunit A